MTSPNDRRDRFEKELYEELYNNVDGFFPPPWNTYENTEKTLGWCEFQLAIQRGDYESHGLKWPK